MLRIFSLRKFASIFSRPPAGIMSSLDISPCSKRFKMAPSEGMITAAEGDPSGVPPAPAIAPPSSSVVMDVPDRSLAERLLALELEQTRAIGALSFNAPVKTVYHPIDYASEPHSDYVRRYCQSPKTVVFVGMNPGPFGMVQSGVPFGDCRTVREWLAIRGHVVRKPPNENPKRPIVGLDCPRSEVSGTRLWTYIRSLAKNDDPHSFFRHCYVHNYCPVAFLDSNGRNITPPTLKKADLIGLEAICDEYLARAIDLLQGRIAVGIGAYAYARCQRILLRKGESEDGNIRVETIMHPSPANPAANSGGGWAVKVHEQLKQLDLLQYMGT